MIIFKTTHDVLSTVKAHIPEKPIIVEGGAFTGHDTQRMALFWPYATIHTFEPVPTLFGQLQTYTAAFSHVICHNQALGSFVGTAELHVAEKPTKQGIPSQASSLLQPKERLALSTQHFPYTLPVSVTTLDAWAEKNNIPRIDFLWLDLQGSELAVLQSAPHMLALVKAVYTEVQFVESYAHNPLYEEVKTWLEAQGFSEIGRDFSEKKHSFFGNILMMRKQ